MRKKRTARWVFEVWKNENSQRRPFDDEGTADVAGDPGDICDGGIAGGRQPDEAQAEVQRMRKRADSGVARERMWRHLDFGGIKTKLRYTIRQVKCPQCGLRGTGAVGAARLVVCAAVRESGGLPGAALRHDDGRPADADNVAVSRENLYAGGRISRTAEPRAARRTHAH